LIASVKIAVIRTENRRPARTSWISEKVINEQTRMANWARKWMYLVWHDADHIHFSS